MLLQYLDDKSQIKDAVRMAEIGLTSAWTLSDFKVAITKYISFPQIIMGDEGLFLEIFNKFVNELKEKECERQEDKSLYIEMMKNNFFFFRSSTNNTNKTPSPPLKSKEVSSWRSVSLSSQSFYDSGSRKKNFTDLSKSPYGHSKKVYPKKSGRDSIRDLSVPMLIETIKRLTKEKEKVKELKSETLLTTVLSEKLYSEEMDIKQLQADLAATVRGKPFDLLASPYSLLNASNLTSGAAENVGTTAKLNGIMHEPEHADRPNAFSNNSSCVLSCIQTTVDISSQTSSPSTFNLPDHTLVSPGHKVIDPLAARQDALKSTIIHLREGFHRKYQNISTSYSEGCGSSVKRSTSVDAGYLRKATVPCTGDGSTWNNIEGFNNDKSIDSGRLSLALHRSSCLSVVQEPEISSLDDDREHRDSNPPVTDSNNVKDVLPNHISFSKELRLQGLENWLQRCRVMLHHVAGTPERAWLLFNLIFIIETIVVDIFRPQTIKL
ncbi:hypothetical protein CQW23_32576 [Capsicum baccatum]|uniref:Uncharacterized protein n=1 Tax=Capsicum baccatum TaxID=33114 RepID=A0A2G2V4A5_CAPBA|nr:hypothetical protein CQW23_32576 [Capsicum baccatum]